MSPARSLPSYKVPVSYCPECQTKLDHATSITKDMVDSNDISLCIECGSVSIFDDDLRLRKPTKDEKNDPEFPWAKIAHAQALIWAENKKRQHK